MPDIAPPAPHTPRRRLPARRRGYTQKFKIGGQTIYLRTGNYPDGTLGEIFLDAAKEGSALRSILNAVAVSTSIGLQHGVPLSEYVDAMVFTRFDPSGVVENHPRIAYGTSFLDVVFRDLAINYLDRADLANGDPKPDGIDLPGDLTAAKNSPAMRRAIRAAEAKASGFEEEPCPNCRRYSVVKTPAGPACMSCRQPIPPTETKEP